ncbi:MAG TPA: thiamine phosphate synthase [Gemmataceae bacterium]|nr:thiamine phosphate synthase [Gemmataceae bacterium]
MKLEFTPALQLAFDLARIVTLRDQAVEVEPRHLLAGLLAEEEGSAVALLVHAGVNWPALRSRLGEPPIRPELLPDLPAHPSIATILSHASDLAVHHGEEGSIATDHVLLALLTANDRLRDELAEVGLDFERLRVRIVGEPAPLIMDEPLMLAEPTEEIDTARILDANANRAREALRVQEDHCRFVLNDALLSGQFKQLRHDLAQALSLIAGPLLLASRDTLHDVGTPISTAAEWHRPSMTAVVQANAKRLQEALRSLEEHGKVLSIEFAQRIEKLRYHTYTLERAIAQGGAARQRLADARLCVLVTDDLCKHSLVGTVKEAILGGARLIQLREKNIDDRTLLARAREVRQVTRSAGALFIVNDRADIARLAEADGVHLGQDDLSIHDARRILGPDALIGVSTHNLDQVRRAVLEGADYLGVGPTFPSRTKEFTDFASLDFVKQAVAETSLPAFAIGGIDDDHVAQVHAAGARRIAVSNAICAADDPRLAAARLLHLLT